MKFQISNLKWAACLALCLVFVSYGQEVLTNEAIIELSQKGVSDRIIIAKIRAAPSTRFDTSAAALVKLSDADVADSVVAAMIDAEAGEKSAANDVPEQGSLADLAGKKFFFVATNDIKSRDRIAKVVAKGGYTAVDRVESADFVLLYREWEEYVQNSNWTNEIGVLEVFMPAKNNLARRRNVYSVRREKFYVFTPEPATATASEFVKDLRKALPKTGPK